MTLIANALIATNIGMGLLLAILEISCYRRYCDPIRWIRLFYALIGLFWAGLYTYILLMGGNLHLGTLQIIVRPGITITLAAMASWAIIQAKSRE